MIPVTRLSPNGPHLILICQKKQKNHNIFSFLLYLFFSVVYYNKTGFLLLLYGFSKILVNYLGGDQF